MKFKCFVILGLFVAVESASIFLKPIDIPVKVVYDDQGFETARSASGNFESSKNLNEKIQLSPDQLKQLKNLEENEHHGNVNSIRNLDAKVQLSPEELLQADRHLPLNNLNEDNQLDLKAVPVEEVESSSVDNLSSSVVPEENTKPTDSNKPAETAFEILGEKPLEKETPAPSSTSASPVTTEENLPDPNVVLLVQLAQNIVMTGLNTIRENVDNVPVDEEDKPPISAEQWDRLNRTISEFFGELLNRVSLRAYNENILQDIVRGVRSTTNNFIQNLNGPSPDQAPAVEQNVLNVFKSGVQRITDNINNISNQNTTKNTVLGDVNVPTTPANPLQNVINQVGQAINNLNPFNQNPTPAPGSEGDDVPTTLNPFQSAVNQVGQAINNLNPFRPTVAPGSQGDEATNNPFQPFQNVVNQVGQAINNLNPFNQQSTPAPGSQGDSPTTSNPNNPFQPFQNVANQVGQAINNIVRPTQAPGSGNEETTNGNNGPFQVVQNVINQVGEAVNNFNPFNQGSQQTGSQNEESSTPQQPLQQFVNQVGQAINNLNPFRPTPPPAGQSEGTATTTNPIQSAINQAGQALSSLNPLNQLSTPAPGSNPLEGVQNAINQAGQQISNLNPANQGSGGSNPLEGVQNAINQAGQSISNLNPVNQGSGGSNPLEGVQNAINQAGQSISNLNPANQGSGGSNPIQSAINQAGQTASNLNPLNQGSGGSNPLQGVQNAVSQVSQSLSPPQGSNNLPQPGSLPVLPIGRAEEKKDDKEVRD